MTFVLKCTKETILEKTGKKVAIIGAGPAGLKAADELICLGHEVHVYDQMPEAGGLLVFGIPEDRIKKESVREYVKQLEYAGVIFKTNVKVGRDVKFADLIKDYDAVLLATGAWSNRRMNLSGVDLKGVYYALDLIIHNNYEKLGYPDSFHPPLLTGTVVVIGGGLTAVDACTLALEKKAEKVILMYRRTKEYAPAGRRMIEKLQSLGVEYDELSQPVEFVGDEMGNLKAVKAVRTRLIENDIKGHPRSVPIESTEYMIPADSVLLATGLIPSFPTDAIDVVKASSQGGGEMFRTNIVNVFIAGDVKHGASFILPAMQSGIQVAELIHEYLVKQKD
ncbi:MAG: FAD-dependent oxidoreductase [Nitrososphaeria archaeon]|jgi:glutamate synthase (NADPH/NADH) small chain